MSNPQDIKLKHVLATHTHRSFDLLFDIINKPTSEYCYTRSDFMHLIVRCTCFNSLVHMDFKAQLDPTCLVSMFI